MPKLKTRKSVAKRFKVTSSGKIKRSKSGASHLLAKKSASRKRRLRKSAILTGGFKKRVKRFLCK